MTTGLSSVCFHTRCKRERDANQVYRPPPACECGMRARCASRALRWSRCLSRTTTTARPFSTTRVPCVGAVAGRTPQSTCPPPRNERGDRYIQAFRFRATSRVATIDVCAGNNATQNTCASSELLHSPTSRLLVYETRFQIQRNSISSDASHPDARNARNARLARFRLATELLPRRRVEELVRRLFRKKAQESERDTLFLEDNEGGLSPRDATRRSDLAPSVCVKNPATCWKNASCFIALFRIEKDASGEEKFARRRRRRRSLAAAPPNDGLESVSESYLGRFQTDLGTIRVLESHGPLRVVRPLLGLHLDHSSRPLSSKFNSQVRRIGDFCRWTLPRAPSPRPATPTMLRLNFPTEKEPPFVSATPSTPPGESKKPKTSQVRTAKALLYKSKCQTRWPSSRDHHSSMPLHWSRTFRRRRSTRAPPAARRRRRRATWPRSRSRVWTVSLVRGETDTRPRPNGPGPARLKSPVFIACVVSRDRKNVSLPQNETPRSALSMADPSHSAKARQRYSRLHRRTCTRIKTQSY